MTHLIQLSVDFDEDSIRRQVENNVAKQIETAIFDGGLYEKNRYYGVKMSSVMRELCEKNVEKFLEEHKDEIINAAAANLADRLSRTKKAKAILEGVEL